MGIASIAQASNSMQSTKTVVDIQNQKDNADNKDIIRHQIQELVILRLEILFFLMIIR